MASNQRKTWLPALLAAYFGVFVAAGCDTGPGESLYDSDRDFRSTPSINSIDPPERSLAGIGTLRLGGENFSSEPEENLVYFNDVRATVLEASSSELVVRSPNLPAENIAVRVTVVGAEAFSTTMTYTLDPAVERFGDIREFEEVFGIATDEEGNAYISLFSSNVSAGIKRISPDGERSHFATSTFKWDALGLSSDGSLYGVRNVRAVFLFPAGGGEAQTFAVVDDRSARFRSLTIDAGDNIWVGGSGGSVYRVTPDAEITASAVASTVDALYVAAGNVYMALDGDPDTVVRRAVLPDGTLGEAEQVFEAPDGVSILALAVTAGGEVLVGTDADDPLFIALPDGSSETFYPDLLSPAALRLAWGTGPMLYMVRGRTEANLPDLVQINTQLESE